MYKYSVNFNRRQVAAKEFDTWEEAVSAINGSKSASIIRITYFHHPSRIDAVMGRNELNPNRDDFKPYKGQKNDN